MKGSRTGVSAFAVAAVAFVLGATAPQTSAGKKAKEEVPLGIAKVYFEYNASANDLGVHVFLDGEDWKTMKIRNPEGNLIFSVEGKKAYKELGMTELFFEGAEPNLADVPLEDLLELFPEGVYEIEGRTVDGAEIEGDAFLSHAIPAAPGDLGTMAAGSTIKITWDSVGDDPPDGFPDADIDIAGYQVIVGSFQVTLPASATSCTLPQEFYDSLTAGTTYDFEALAIEENGNQTITEGTFTK